MSLIPKLTAALIEQNCLPNTVTTYCHWARKFYGHCRKSASQWTGPDVLAWLLHLHALRYSNTSRKQALCAVKFVFDHVLKADLGQLDLPPMPRQRQTLRIIPSREELGRLFAGMKGTPRLMAAMLYGSGLRVNECCHLRVQDLDFAALTVSVLHGKGDKTRRTVLPVRLVEPLRRHLALRQALHAEDLANGRGLVELPGRLAQKYRNASREFRWQWLFPSTLVRGQYRWHATPECVAKAMRVALLASGITKRVTPHTLRHAFVTHGLQAGNDFATMQELVGHEDANTTLIYAHGDVARGFSPLDVPPRPQPASLEFAP